MGALWWLKNYGDWSVFVANRVNEINRLVPSPFWRHVPGELNPADLLSRGSSRLFSDSLWWEGPSLLLEPPSNWPIDRLACETSEVEREKKEINHSFYLVDVAVCEKREEKAGISRDWKFDSSRDRTRGENSHKNCSS
ncbi:integrase catalytic domain-containing protein [Trichonephila clavipes]|uniref:Integrase catalytic domain-containing protein n=1 Tax=Trichonephila clavipes TaxID=2585209 RepID=A0A8X6WHJ9_TRICX|nr:integrase catalytic domain-containing protein [Trichonephila clavipes]